MPTGDRAGPGRDAPEQPAAGGWRLPLRPGLLLLLLLGCVLLELTRHPPDGTARDPAATTTVTLAIQHDIEAALDGYGPLLRADTPLLQRPYDTEGGAANDAESWVLPTAAGKISPVCEQLLYHSHDCQPGPEDACQRLTRNLRSAAEDHRRVARSLAGPRTGGLWLSHVEAPLLGLLWSLDNTGAAPRRLEVTGPDGDGPQHATAADDGADGGQMEVTAMLMRGYVKSQRDPQRSTNGKIRRALLPLREKCASIVADIRLISGQDASDGACGWAELSPLAGQVQQVVSAADDILAALDAVDGVLLRLDRLLERMPRGYLEVDEVAGGTVVRTRFELPPPAVMSRSVAARLGRMREDASALQQGWVPPQPLATGLPGGGRGSDLKHGHGACATCAPAGAQHPQATAARIH
ncbi:hypothetical protein KVR01_007614 [Diaporthe batatas]|uniref:uncharacterized protein n=1 Tax=Diaporthe batatas TaxID=748121 RepID=UPI001D04A841|nr:uncharacterized protein KVR01_007614 [Diaporthe batatas]KAG8163136.1 hypothetical protein KVR01_007614 [Diaporthe batatas]